MLIGIVCEVITETKQEEEIQAGQFFLETHLRDILECYDMNDDECIGRDEFSMWMGNPEVVDALNQFGTDPEGVKTLADILFGDSEKVVHKNGRVSYVANNQVVLRRRAW